MANYKIIFVYILHMVDFKKQDASVFAINEFII